MEGIAKKEKCNMDNEIKANGSAPEGAVATEEEIRKAKELLRANGYGLVAYREAGDKVKRTVGSGLDFVKGKCKAFGGWFSAKRDELKTRLEERSRTAAEKRRLAEEAVARNAAAEPVSGESVAGNRPAGSGDAPKCAACGAELVAAARFCRKCGKPVSIAPAAKTADPPAEEKTASADGKDPAGSAASKCAVCGAALAAGMKFCGECGTPVNAGGAKPRRKKTAVARKSSRKAKE